MEVVTDEEEGEEGTAAHLRSDFNGHKETRITSSKTKLLFLPPTSPHVCVFTSCSRPIRGGAGPPAERETKLLISGAGDQRVSRPAGHNKHTSTC